MSSGGIQPFAYPGVFARVWAGIAKKSLDISVQSPQVSEATYLRSLSALITWFS
jgi:hypothetical protein